MTTWTRESIAWATGLFDGEGKATEAIEAFYSRPRRYYRSRKAS